MDHSNDSQPDEFRERYTKKKSFRQAYKEEFVADSAKDAILECFELSSKDVADGIVKLALTAPSDGIRLKASMYVVDTLTSKKIDDEDSIQKLFKSMSESSDAKS